MDPFTALGAASASLSIISNMVPALVKLKEHWDGIRQIDDTNSGFIDELEAFEFSLALIDTELRKHSSTTAIDAWWDIGRMERLLINASKTVSRLEAMFLDVGRERKLMQNIRAYYRASMYDKEVGHLLLRIKTYTMSLSMPIMLRALQSDRQSSSSPAISAVAVDNRIHSIESTISQISEDLRTVCIKLQGRSQDKQSVNLSEESEELTEIAADLVKEASSVASSVNSDASTIRPAARSAGWASVSLDGIPVGPSMRQRIHDWRNTTSAGSGSTFPTSASRSPIETPATSFTYVADENEDADLDIEDYIVKRRYIHATELCKKRRFKQAIPYIKKTLESFTDSTERSIRRSVLILLVQAALELPKTSVEITTYLKDALKHSDPDEIHEVLHLQARLEFKMDPMAPDIAKQTCFRAIKARSTQFGRKHKLTIESMQLMSDICVVSRDQDADVWALEEGVTKIWHRDDILTLLIRILLFVLLLCSVLAIIGGSGIALSLVFLGIPWLWLLSLRHSGDDGDTSASGVIFRLLLFGITWTGLLTIIETGVDPVIVYVLLCASICILAYVGFSS